MDYIAFALKYRPQNFDEVVGQDHVVTSLKNAILKKHIHHAYLFSGPRGTGKTSLARIFAKALNCESSNEPVMNPCGKCLSCIEISKGASLDIIEIDGASNRGIDEIRTLRENVKLSPARSRYKVYIIDEVHMLTQEAFNALLKTLEEPPKHVKFIFATTHPHKVIPTILSRCQKFQFGLVSLEKIVAKLKAITKTESVKIDDNLLYAIARAAGGSIRDAESLLDQLVPVILEKGSIDNIFSFLGIVDEASLSKMLENISKKDLPAALDSIDAIVKSGKDLSIFINALIEYLRNLLLAKISLKTFKELMDVSTQTKENILKVSSSISVSEILLIVDLLIEAKELSHRLNTARIPFELALIRFFYPVVNEVSQSKNIKPIESNVQAKPVSQKTNKDDFDKSGVVKLEGDFDLDSDSSSDALQKKESDADSEKDNNANNSDDCALLEEVKNKWPEIIANMHKVRAAISSHLALAQPISSSSNIVKVGFAKKDYFHKEIVESAKNTKFIEETISKIINKKVGIKFILSENVSVSSVNPVAEASQYQSQNESGPVTDKQNEFINELMDTFGGQLHTDDE